MDTIDMELLDRISDEFGVKVEIDAAGSIVVTPPAEDPHVITQSVLLVQIAAVLPADLFVLQEGPQWTPLGGDTPCYVPDLAVVHLSAMRRGKRQYSLAIPPVLVVEVLSPSTRRRDLTDKAESYFAGGALAYWTIDVPGQSAVDRPTLVARRRGATGWEVGDAVTGVVHFDEPFPVTIDLDRLRI